MELMDRYSDTRTSEIPVTVVYTSEQVSHFVLQVYFYGLFTKASQGLHHQYACYQPTSDRYLDRHFQQQHERR